MRQHPEDIPPLAQHFWGKVQESAKAQPLSADVLKELQLWRWPGNVREIRSFLWNAHAFAGGRTVTVELIRNVFVDRLGPHVSMVGAQER